MKRRKGDESRRQARLAALFEFLEARTSADMRQSLIRHPELLDDETDALIGGLLLQAREAGRIDIAEGLEERRALLARERARVRGGEQEGELPARVREMIAEIGELTGPGDLDRRIDLLRRVLADPAVSSHARLRAALSGFLGASLADRCDRLGSRDYAEAVSALKVAFDAPPGAYAASSRRKVALDLGRIYARHAMGNRRDNLEAAIRYLTEALQPSDDQPHPPVTAEAQVELAGAYLKRVAGTRAGNVREAIRHLEAAGQFFTSQASPDEWAAIQGSLEERAAALTGLGVAVSGRTTGEPGAAADLAIGYHEAALHVLGERDASPGLWAVIQNNLGTVYLERGGPRRHEDLSSAIACLADALVGGAGRSPLEQAMTRHNLGAAYAERARDSHDGDLRKAINHLEAALEAFASTGLPAYQRGTGQALGDAYARLGDHWNEALAAYESALAAADALYVTSLSRSAREAELSEAPALHLNAAYAAAKAGQLERAAITAERGRARSLGDALARDQAELGQIRQQSPDLADEFAAAAARLRDLEAAEWLAPAIVPVPGAGVAASHATGSGGLRQRLGKCGGSSPMPSAGSAI
jgi:tetratricopeptide (TPR) repeat protein